MNELIQIAFSPVNLIYTFLLILVIIYWLTVIIGVLDFGSLDIDFDVDVDADLDMDLDTEIDAGGAGSLAGVFQFWNAPIYDHHVFCCFIFLGHFSFSQLLFWQWNNYFPINIINT